jgi:hypothetical protein
MRATRQAEVMKLAAQFLSLVLVIVVWVVASIRAVLDIIGYASLPNTAAAGDRYRSFFLWLLNTNGWLLFLVAFVLTTRLIWVSWPGAKLPRSRQKDEYTEIASQARYLSQRLRTQERGTLSDYRLEDGNLPDDLRAFYRDLEQIGFSVPKVACPAHDRRAWYAANAYYLACIRPLLSQKKIRAAITAAADAARHVEADYLGA